jgi:Spy/CpxP family protein refolding chaperone
MKTNRLANLTALLAGLVFLCGMPALADSAPHGSMQTPAPAAPRAQAAADSGLADDFAGLDLTDDQKAQIANIHQGSAARKAVVAKDQKLDSDQKDAMILGYTRMEYGQIFKVLTPIQQKLVRKRMQDRRVAEQAAHQKQKPTTPHN